MINICYTGDEGYAMQIATSITSILENNKNKDICFYILGDAYSDTTMKRFCSIEKKYKTKIEIVDITDKMRTLEKTALYNAGDVKMNGLLTFMYARLFIGSVLPTDIEKVIYIDADTVVQGDIQTVYNKKLPDVCIIGAVRDIWPMSYNKVIHHEDDDLYFISSFLLIDLTKWRKENIEKQIMKHIKSLNKKYFMHDQDIINVCLKGKIDTLPLEWGMVYIVRAYTPEQILWFSGKTEETFYTKKQISSAKKRNLLVHYAGDYYGRPWVFPNACHDSRIWYRYFKMTPWANDKLNYVKNKKQIIIFYIKKVLEKPIKNYWLKRTKRRFERIILNALKQ